MIQLPPQLQIMLAYDPVDFRKGIDTLTALCRNRFDQNPFSGTLFLFRNRRATALKLLVYDGQGFWLCTKRFSKGRLAWWPEATGAPLHPLAAHQLSVLLMNGHPDLARFADAWRRLPTATPVASLTPLASAPDVPHTATATTASDHVSPPAHS
ncbi:MAG: IS66 family insertion sequence element accessory protein TnpB [Acidobacteriota bacterium]|nr:IS66 family insertion sequence element accessory protein TnpB [Acidobacteriota bacterium]